jgi:DNA-binding MarR family transcriptional regulator
MAAPRDSVDDFLDHALQVFPTLDAEVEAVVDRVAHLRTYFDRLTESRAKRYELNRGEFKVLLKLRQVVGEQLSPGALADTCLLSTGAMTNRIDRLEAEGLVVRERHPQDRRGVIVRLTERGRTLTDEAVADIAREEQRIVRTLSPAEQRRLNDLLRKLMLTFESEPGA